MKKIFIFLTLLLAFAGAITANAQAWRPTQRAATLVAGRQYMLYNTANGSDDRTGFLFNNGSGLGHTGNTKVEPLTFVQNNSYVWTLEPTGNACEYYMKSVSSNTYVGPAGVTNNTEPKNLYIQPWPTSQAPKSDVGSKNDNGTTTANADITDNNKVYTICGTGLTSNGQSNGAGDCWNGNPDSWAKWSGAHPYAFYEVEQLLTAEETNAYDAAKEKLNNAAFVLQGTFGLVKAATQYTSNAQQTTEGSIEALLDGNASTYFHSRYSGTFVDAYHHLQADLTTATKSIRFYLRKRNNNNRPTEIQVLGSNNGTDFTEITTISSGLPTDASVDDYYSGVIQSETAYRYYRFVVKSTNTGNVFKQGTEGEEGYKAYPFFTLSEFYILPGDNELVNKVIEAKNTINALAYSDENFNTVVAECAGTYTDLENAAKTVTINYVYDNKVFATSERTALVGNRETYTSTITRYGLVCDETEKTITIGEDDANNVVTFTYRLDENVTMPFEVTTDINGAFPEDTKWYALTLRGKNSHYDEASNEIQNKANDIILTDNHLFAITGDFARGFKIYNKVAGATKVIGGGNVSTNTHVTMTEDGETAPVYILENNEGHLVFRKDGTDLGYLNDVSNSTTPSFLGYWVADGAKTDVGSTFTFTAVEGDIDVYNAKLALTTAINKANVYTGTGDDLRLGEGVNLYSGISREDLVAKVAEANDLIANGTDASSINAKTEELNTILSNLHLNEVPQGKFYNIRCTASNNTVRFPYLTSDVQTAANKQGRLLMNASKGKNTIFYYDNNKLLAYSNGQYVNEMVFAAIGASGAETSFNDGTNLKVGAYTLKCGSRWLFGSQDDNILDSGSGTPDREGYTWWLEEVTTLPVSVGTSGFATLWSPVALDIPADVTAYTATLDDVNNTLVLEEIADGVIPAKTGVVLKAAQKDYNFNISANAGTATSDLTGSVNTKPYDKDAADAKKVYTLQNVEDGMVGFKAYNGTQLTGFKARLETERAVAETLRMIFGESTGINGIEADCNKTLNIFDLNGRRVSAPAKGVYIVNGHKVIFK